MAWTWRRLTAGSAARYSRRSGIPLKTLSPRRTAIWRNGRSVTMFAQADTKADFLPAAGVCALFGLVEGRMNRLSRGAYDRRQDEISLNEVERAAIECSWSYTASR